MKGVVLFCLLAAATAAALTIPNYADQNSQPKILFRKCFGRLSASNAKDDAITNLRKDKKAATLTLDQSCKDFMAQGRISIDADNIHYNPHSNNACLVGIRLNPLVRGKAGEEVSLYKPGVIPPYVSARDPNEDTAAFYLTQDVDKNTYMILDSANADWFFTAQLGGCDIFVATSDIVANRNMPLIIHANANSRVNTPTDNLQAKEDGANTIIRSHGNGYDIKARVYRVRDGDQAYWTGYRTDVKIYRYNTVTPTLQQFYFFGYFDGKAWRFYLKAKITGKVTNITL